ncbi:MAG: hypothetical protein ACPGJV_00630 [Bacteriovoracaceae bacterium]
MIFNLKTFHLLFLTFFFTSCGLFPETKNNQTQTQKKSFREIEKERALKKYYQLRLERLKRRKQRQQSRTSKKPRYSKPKVRVVRPKKPKKIAGNPDEIRIESEQILSYHCMQHRKTRKYPHPDKCLQYTKIVAKECQEKFDVDDKQRIYCINKKLR